MGLYAATLLAGMNYRVAAVPQDFASAGSATDFDPAVMTRLFDEGRKQALAGTALAGPAAGGRPGRTVQPAGRGDADPDPAGADRGRAAAGRAAGDRRRGGRRLYRRHPPARPRREPAVRRASAAGLVLTTVSAGDRVGGGPASRHGIYPPHPADLAWIAARAADPGLRTAPPLPVAGRPEPAAPAAVIRHARTDRLLASFEANV